MRVSVMELGRFTRCLSQGRAAVAVIILHIVGQATDRLLVSPVSLNLL